MISEFEMVGMSGSVASVNATYVVHKKCTYRLGSLQDSRWLSLNRPLELFNLLDNYRNNIFVTTKGYTGRGLIKCVSYRIHSPSDVGHENSQDN